MLLGPKQICRNGSSSSDTIQPHYYYYYYKNLPPNDIRLEQEIPLPPVAITLGYMQHDYYSTWFNLSAV
jgi:hypothetical protein